MRQQVTTREHFRRGNAPLIQIVALQLRDPGARCLAVSMNIGPLVLTNSGPPQVCDLLSRAEARLSRSASFLYPPHHDFQALRCAAVRRNR